MTSHLLADLDAATVALERVSVAAAEFRALDEASLLQLNRRWADANRKLGAGGALIAGEIARRSAPELGAQGLARRSGLRTPEQFIKVTTGVPAQQAGTAVKVGIMVLEAQGDGLVDPETGEVGAPARPWLIGVSELVRTSRLTTAGAASIASGLGSADGAVTAEQLTAAAAILCDEGVGSADRPGLDADSLFRRARALRDELDLEGVAIRTAQQREQRGVRFVDLPTGMSRLIWDMDPESAAPVKQLFDRATSPKLGGVRFVDPSQAAVFTSILDDPRTPAQLASDAFLHLLMQGSDAPTDFLLGSGAPVIKIAATRRTVETRRGLVYIEGRRDAVSIDVLERQRCNGITETTNFDENGIPLDMGRDQRLFTKRQKSVLALKWGGCACPDCDRPPSWTEAHHINFYKRDEGKTDIADGIPLCKYHHLLFHNFGWEIERDDFGQYWLTPPASADPAQKRILLQPKGGVMRDLERERAAG